MDEYDQEEYHGGELSDNDERLDELEQRVEQLESEEEYGGPQRRGWLVFGLCHGDDAGDDLVLVQKRKHLVVHTSWFIQLGICNLRCCHPVGHVWVQNLQFSVFSAISASRR